ncbi:MAG: phosphotransferase [Actinomycetota bacterium]
MAGALAKRGVSGRAGALVRALHDASAGFEPVDPVWRMHERPMRSGEIVCHADYGVWNTVYRDGLPVALIDWDSARPVVPLVDLAAAAWAYVPLVDSPTGRILGFDRIDHGRRLRIFLDAYRLEERSGFVEALQLAKQRETENLRYWRGIRPLRAMEWLEGVAGDLRWLAAHREPLEAATR